MGNLINTFVRTAERDDLNDLLTRAEDLRRRAQGIGSDTGFARPSGTYLLVPTGAAGVAICGVPIRSTIDVAMDLSSYEAVGPYYSPDEPKVEGFDHWTVQATNNTVLVWVFYDA